MGTIKRDARTGKFVTRSNAGGSCVKESRAGGTLSLSPVPKGKPSKRSQEAVEVNAGRFSDALIRLANR